MNLYKIWRLTLIAIGCSLLCRGGVSTTYASTLNCATAVNINVPVLECQALLDLYDSTNGTSWTNGTNRDTDTNVCTRYGITCSNFSGQNRVYNLALPFNNLIGTLPPSLSGLDKMNSLLLYSNNITGTLPDAWGTWTGITYFDVKSNNITGPLPTSWSAWTNIQTFLIASNNLTGPLPSSWSTWTNMHTFWAFSNQLDGTLPTSWSAWTAIDIFSVGNNQFTGTLPTSWSTRTSINQFNVSTNQLDGTLPTSWSAWTTINEFTINNNQFTGTLPTSWSTRTSINQFNVSTNQLDGTLPTSWSAWVNIQLFYVSQNLLTGTLPPSWSGWTNIMIFDVHQNLFIGTLPTSWSTWVYIDVFYVSDNQLDGSLPISWSSWTGISQFYVSNNQLIGYVPTSWYTNRGTLINGLSDIRNNCIIVNGYSTGMQAWLTAKFQTTPQSTSCVRLTYLTGVGGNISGDSIQSIFSGGNGSTVTAIPDTGYSFSGWSDGNTGATRFETNVTGDQTYTGYFTINMYTLTYSGSIGGSISGSISQTVAYGLSGTTVTAIPDTGYSFSGWSDGYTGVTRFETNVTGDMIFTGYFTFIPVNHTVTYLTGAGGTISGTSVQTVASGGNGTSVTAVPATGYIFSGWSDGNTGATRFETNVTGDLTFTGYFTLSGGGGSSFTVTYLTGAGGMISGTSVQTVASGSNGTTVTAVPATGYIFSGWSDGNTGATRFETNVTGDQTYTGYFSTIPVVIITSGGGGGGGGGGQLVDNCPNGDFSPSYYDNTCVGSGGTGTFIPSGSGTIGSTGGIITGHGAAPLFNQDFVCKYTDGDFERYKTSFTDMGSYRNAIRVGLQYCIYHGQKKGVEFRPNAYTTYGASYKIFVRLAGLEVRESSTKLGNKRSDRYKKIGTKAGLRKGVSFPANPDTLIDSRVFAKMLQNLFNYYGYSDLQASDFVKGNGKLTRGKMSQIVAAVIAILEQR